MDRLSVPVSQDLRDRLQKVADRTGLALDEVLELALKEFADNWETHLDDVARIDEDEARAVLKAVNE